MQQENINKSKRNKNVIKLALFFLLSAFVYLFILLCIVYLPLVLYSGFIDPFLAGVFNDKDAYEVFSWDIALFYFPIAFSTFAMYIYAKIFGVFKLVDELNISFFKKNGYIILMTILLMISMFSGYIAFGINLETSLLCSCFSFSLIPAFFLYKLFQFLTKKYPRPFEKIGYYCSIEFYKQLLTKLKKS